MSSKGLPLRKLWDNLGTALLALVLGIIIWVTREDARSEELKFKYVLVCNAKLME